MTTTPLNHYQVMMVDPEVDADILATVYRRLVQRYQTAADGPSSLRRLQAVERAYEVLSDPHRRFRYDAQLSDEAERVDTLEPTDTPMHVVTAVRDVPKQPAVVPVVSQRVAMAERLGGRPLETTQQPAAPVARHSSAGYGSSATHRSQATYQSPATTRVPATQASATKPGSANRSVPVSVLDFGRYAGWSLRQLAAHDPDYLEWLLRSPGGRQYRAEITALLPQR